MTKHLFHVKTAQIRLFCAIAVISLLSCEKFLDEKSDKKIATPSSLDDLSLMLDNYSVLNARNPSAGEISSDDFYVTASDFQSLNERERSFYSWQKYDLTAGDWSSPYNNILHANVILENVEKFKEENRTLANTIMGKALFLRAFNHFTLSQLYASSFDQNTADSDLGIPIRTTSDHDIRPFRATNLETYSAILNDVLEAIPLLPGSLEQKQHGSRPAAYGLLARVYLSMRYYEKAEIYADSCLRHYDKLIDYNTINPNISIPFPQRNEEVIFDARSASPSILTRGRAKVDTVLLSKYEDWDLRKSIFFLSNANGSKAFKGSYTGLSTSSIFVGLATDEIYLIRAECFARRGKLAEAMADLNHLMRHRYNNNRPFIPFTASSADDALNIILMERRKELLFRGIRWSDLRRLNMENSTKTILTRFIDGKEYKLLPKSSQYVLQIPRESIEFSGMEQNP